MEEAGLVHRARPEHDRRTILVVLTDKGTEMMVHARGTRPADMLFRIVNDPFSDVWTPLRRPLRVPTLGFDVLTEARCLSLPSLHNLDEPLHRPSY